MVAFSNTDGGLVLIGVRDDRSIAGRARTQGIDDDIHGAALDARNVGRYEIRELTVGHHPVVAVVVQPRTDEVAQTGDGRVLVRRGGHNRPLFGRDLFELLARRSLRRFEATDSGLPVVGVSQELAQEVADAFGWPDSAAFQQRWQERGFLHESGNLTVAGALLLTDPATALRAAKFHVDVRSYEADAGTAYVRREIIGGPVQRQVERTTDLVVHDIGTEMVVTGAYRHDVPRLPRRAVREAVANAVAHRSYEFDGTPVVIEVRPSRVLVSSPGRLPEPVTVENLRQAQVARNHTVIDALRRFGLAEDSGQGIDVMQDTMRLELLEPVFREETDTFQVELPVRGLVSTTERGWLAEFERTGLVGDQERLLLLTLLREGKVTNARARDVLGADSTDARARLHRLRDAGLVVQHGTRGRAYYTPGSIGPSRSSEQVVLDAAAQGPVTNASVRHLTGLDRDATRALLRRLVDERRLIQHGVRRGTTYTAPR